MKKNLTELVMVLDRSGSMRGLEDDTIGGYNSMLEKQKKEEGEVLVSTILFDDRIEVIHDRVDIREVKDITDREYYVRGCTALLDAIGGTIRHIENIHKYAREEDVPEKTIFIIITDGYENASRSYTLDQVKEMVSGQQARGWEFLFLGANIDAIAEAARFGISADRAVSYRSRGRSVRLNYDVLSKSVATLRSHSTLKSDWKAEIEEDFAKTED